MKEFKSGYVSIVGRANVGKSTMLNSLIGQKISAISNKAQTTREKISFIYTDKDCQIVFLDTPGIQKPKNKLGNFMLNESLSSLSEADIITYIVDTSKKIGKLDSSIIDTLKKLKDKKIILLINKIDLIAKEELFPIIEVYDKIGIFSHIIPISAMKNDGVDEYIEVIKENLSPGPMFYPEDYVTDKSEKFLAEEIIREKGLRFLQEEVPHGLAVGIEKFKMRSDKEIYDIDAVIYVERDSHKAIVIGKGGSMLKKIGTSARRELENMLDSKVNLKLWVKVSKNWRDNDNKVRGFGYK
ncbi:GTPase Era [Peptoniphilus lacrimalis]|uniref:GTPase Era n=1 Tax=Peptoniphilus lacrimalis TaxID=33031 RepID=A0A379C4X6_9FIRM|nr:GTPase Era [Peptoniphilus lacrimalis]SUB56785.1 GTPase Era [Peptoniphilus lacrimalis]